MRTARQIQSTRELMGRHLDAAEHADDAEGAHEAEDADGQVDGPQRHEGHGDDEEVEHAPVCIRGIYII